MKITPRKGNFKRVTVILQFFLVHRAASYTALPAQLRRDSTAAAMSQESLKTGTLSTFPLPENAEVANYTARVEDFSPKFLPLHVISRTRLRFELSRCTTRQKTQVINEAIYSTLKNGANFPAPTCGWIPHLQSIELTALPLRVRGSVSAIAKIQRYNLLLGIHYGSAKKGRRLKTRSFNYKFFKSLATPGTKRVLLHPSPALRAGLPPPRPAGCPTTAPGRPPTPPGARADGYERRFHLSTGW